jgi:predicted nucleic acid-binding protein
MALRVLWDASALAKRYALEVGTAAADALWATVPASEMGATFTAYAESHAILLRNRNGRIISEALFGAARAQLRLEIINSLDFLLLAVETVDVLAGIDLTERHNLNSADAAILATFLRYSRASSDKCLLVAADQRLLRAAGAEGLATLNPKALPAADVPAFLASL